MERNTVFSKIEEYLKTKMTESYEINEDTALSHIGITSIEFVLLLVFVESDLDVTFDDDDLLMSNDITVGELIDRIIKLHDKQGH